LAFSEPGRFRGDVVQVEMPEEDITLHFVEARSGMEVQLKAPCASVQSRKLYIGDGAVAIELTTKNEGILFQRRVRLDQADQFKNGSLIKVRDGFKTAGELTKGDVYVILPGVTFVEPGMLEAEWAGQDKSGRRIALTLAAGDSAKLTIGSEVVEGTYLVGWYKENRNHHGSEPHAANDRRPRVWRSRPSQVTESAIILTRRAAQVR
jgi:hypothetical protein